MVYSPSSQFLTNKISALDWNDQTSSPQSRHPSNVDGCQVSSSSQMNKEGSMRHQSCLGDAIINPYSPSFGNGFVHRNKNQDRNDLNNNQMTSQNLYGATSSSSDTDGSGMINFLQDVDL